MLTRAETPDMALRAGGRAMFIAPFTIAAGRLLRTSGTAGLRTTTANAILRAAALRRARLRGGMLGTLLTTGLSALRPALLSALLLMARTVFGHMSHDLGVIKSFRPFPHNAATDEAF